MMKVFVVTIDDADVTKVPAVFRKEEEAKTYLIEGFVNQFGNDDEEIIKIDKALKKAKLNKTPNKPDYSLHLWLRDREGMEDDEEYDEKEYEYTEEDDKLYDDNGIDAAKEHHNPPEVSGHTLRTENTDRYPYCSGSAFWQLTCVLIQYLRLQETGSDLKSVPEKS